MRLEIELRCILFPLIILEMFLQLDWIPPVVNSIDWTLLGKAHTCLYKVTQLTVYVRSKTKPWGRRNCPLRSEAGLCKLRFGEGYQKMSAALKVSKNTVVFIILELCQIEQSGEKGLGQGGDQEPDSHSDRAPEFLCGVERTFQKDNHLCITPPIWPLW